MSHIWHQSVPVNSLETTQFAITTAVVTFMNISSYLISRIHRRYSLLFFKALGKAKNEQVLPSDEWLQVGAKQKTISFRLCISPHKS